MFKEEEIIEMIKVAASEYKAPEEQIRKYEARLPKEPSPQNCLTVIQLARHSQAFIDEGFKDAFKARENIEIDAYLRGSETDIVKVARKAVVMDDSKTIRQEIDAGCCKVTGERLGRSIMAVQMYNKWIDNVTPYLDGLLKRVLLNHGLVFLHGIKDDSLKIDEWSEIENICMGIIELQKWTIPRDILIDARIKVCHSVYGYKSDKVMNLNFKDAEAKKEA